MVRLSCQDASFLKTRIATEASDRKKKLQKKSFRKKLQKKNLGQRLTVSSKSLALGVSQIRPNTISGLVHGPAFLAGVAYTVIVKSGW